MKGRVASCVIWKNASPRTSSALRPFTRTMVPVFKSIFEPSVRHDGLPATHVGLVDLSFMLGKKLHAGDAADRNYSEPSSRAPQQRPKRFALRRRGSAEFAGQLQRGKAAAALKARIQAPISNAMRTRLRKPFVELLLIVLAPVPETAALQPIGGRGFHRGGARRFFCFVLISPVMPFPRILSGRHRRR